MDLGSLDQDFVDEDRDDYQILSYNNRFDVNKILPMKYPWAWDYYRRGVANHWVPDEVPMQDDIKQWNQDELTEKERKLVEWNLGFFSTAESLTGNNIVLSIYDHVTAPECRQYLLRQAFEEAIHTHMFVYCCDTLGLDSNYIFGMYDRVPSIKEKDRFVVDLTKTVNKEGFSIDTEKDGRSFLKDLIGFYVIMEGIFFYGGFASMLYLKRQGKMKGLGEQFEFTLRDEGLHVAFGIDLINQIKEENPEFWNRKFKNEIRDLILEAYKLEDIYIEECNDGVLGLTRNSLKEYIQYITDRRLKQLDMKEEFGVDNPFSWMSQQVDLQKEKNFFETTVQEYNDAGSLNW